MNDPVNTNSEVWIAVARHANERIVHFRGVLEEPECTDKTADLARGFILGMKSVLALAHPAPHITTLQDDR